MNEIMQKTEQYLEETLDVSVEISPSDLSTQLPYYFTEFYRFYNLIINGVSYLLCEGRELIPAKQVRTQLSDLESRMGKQAIYLNDAINANLRRSLVENRVSFIIPRSQIFLPNLGTVFTERYRNPLKTKEHLTPAAQVILISALVNREYELVTASEYAKQLKYTVMSVSRAFNELKEFNLVTREEHWKERPIKWLFRGRELWEKALPLLINPMRRAIWVQSSGKLTYCVAGITALSRYSMLNEDDYLTYATISSIANDNVDMVEVNSGALQGEQANLLQIWRYNPKLITNGEIVDQLSLYLSLMDSPDERVHISLDKMMGGIRW